MHIFQCIDAVLLQLEHVVIEPLVVCRELVGQLMQQFSSMVAPSVKLEVVVSDDMPHLLYLDDLRIKQLLANGLTNAIKVCRRVVACMFVVTLNDCAPFFFCSTRRAVWFALRCT